MAILYRTAGAWGSGLGRRLTKAEVDGNWYQLKQAIDAAVASIPTAARSIDHIEQPTADTFQFVMTDASTEGPFTLPNIIYAYKGAWSTSTSYVKYDRFTRNGSLYEVLYPHVSDSTTFDAGANDGMGHDYYELILANPAGTLPTGGAAGALLSKIDSTDFNFEWINKTDLALPFTALTGVATSSQIPTAGPGSIGGVRSKAFEATKFLTAIGTDGVVASAQPDFTDISGTIDPSQLPPAGSGTYTPMEVGFIGSSVTLNSLHANKYLRCDNGSTPIVITIPRWTTEPFDQGTEFTFIQVGTGTLSFQVASGGNLNVPAGFLAQAYGRYSVITLKNAQVDYWDLMGLLAPTP